ncbi:MAG: diphthine--ammonia ligase [Deltaproteobacteria bacterium]|nr:diphthine--ammonia ligase [Deltaproteobacteria bacterium]
MRVLRRGDAPRGAALQNLRRGCLVEQAEKLKAVVSWSGGKDAALSCWRAMRRYHVTHLLNMMAEDGLFSRSHRIRADVLRLQGEAMGLPVVQVSSSWETYEPQFKEALSGLKEEGVRVGIFGDIDLEEHRQWVERVSGESGMEAVLPLWGEMVREQLIEELITAGFEAVVVAVRRDLLGPEWLGRRIDRDFVRDISRVEGVDISGEGGEYHTLVLSGPLFARKIRITRAETVTHDNHSFLDIRECALTEKDDPPGGVSGGRGC